MDEQKLALTIADHMNRDVDTLQTVAHWLATGGAIRCAKAVAADLQKSESE